MAKHKYILAVLLVSFHLEIVAQGLPELTLSDAYHLLEGQYPLLSNKNVLNEIYLNEVTQIDKTRLPTIHWMTDGRLQSESVHLQPTEGMLPFDINLPLFNAKTFLQGSYVLLDGWKSEVQKELKRAQLEFDQQALDVRIYALREVINDLFLRIVLLRQQTELTSLVIDQLEVQLKEMRARVDMGVVLPSEHDKLAVKLLELRSQQSDFNHQIEGEMQTLSSLLGIEFDEDIDLIMPDLPDLSQIPPIEHPEIRKFAAQRESIKVRSDLTDVALQPKLSVFAQAGLGYPNPLNFFDDKISPYALIGAQLSWPISDWKKSSLEKEKLVLEVEMLENAEATFLFNIEKREARYLNQVKNLQSKIADTREIIQLHEQISSTKAAQLNEGVITAAEYTAQITAQMIEQQNLLIYETELKKIQINYWHQRGADL